MDSGLALLYIFAAIFAVIIGLLLAQMARQQGESRLRLERQKRAVSDAPREQATAAQIDKPVHESIVDELSRVVESPAEAGQVGKKVLDIFNRELDKKLDEARVEIGRKYESVINEKIQEQEVVWQKYNKAVSEKKETEAVMRSIADGLVVVDSKGKVVMMNPAAEKLLGVSLREKRGKPINENVKEEQLISMVKADANSKDREIELSSQQDETKRIIRSSSAVIENEVGQTVGMVAVLSDITKQKELDQMKTNFVTSVSHELRTPLVAIDKSLSLILSKTAGPLTENQEQFLTMAERNLKRLERLINDVLDLSKLEAGKMQVNKQAFSIAELIQDTVLSLENWAKTKSISIATSLQADLPSVEMDPDRITQVLNNLIGNAIKYTPEQGSINIAAGLKQGFLEVSVQNSGPGISKENLEKIFDKFYQIGQKVSSEAIRGTGIGLSVAKEIVQLHGGKIWTESELGKFTRFIFTLPLGVG